VTVVVPFDTGLADAVEAHLDGLNVAPLPLNGPAPRSITQMLNDTRFVHFMSFTVVRGSSGGSAHLVWVVSADGYPAGVLSRLAEVIGPHLRGVLTAACIEVPAWENLSDFLVRHDYQVGQGWFDVPGAVFTGTPGVSVERILEERELASWIQRVLDDLPARGSALATLEHVRAKVFGDAMYKWAFVAEPVPLLADAPTAWKSAGSLLWSALRTLFWPLGILPGLSLWGGWRVAIVVLGAELILVGIALRFAYAKLRRQESADAPEDLEISAEAIRTIMERENNGGVQNHLAAVSTMKPGRLRGLTLRLALWAVAAFSAYHSRPGFLRNIGTIHFARWIRLPRTDKLLFFSNYTGSWESYLEDFIMQLHEGLTAIWSNTQGFPRTKNLVQDGARAADRFKRWARRQQHPTRFWYSAYPMLTTHRIRTNAAIRHGLATAATEAEATRWLVHFRFAPTTLQSEEIPTLVFGGLLRLRCAQSFMLQLPDVAEKGRGWLRAIEGEIGYGERRRAGSMLALGLSHSGLQGLGLDAHALSTFPTVFQHGMAASWRSRALGDVGDNAPQNWCWGGPDTRRVDAIVNVYAENDDTLTERIAQMRVEFRHFGVEIVHELQLDRLPANGDPIREPFGFTDGVSQPIVRGTRRSFTARNDINVVDAGEMILGYPDNLEQIAASPFSARCPKLGHNGTYLVVRQLEQDTVAFRRYLDTTAGQLIGNARVPELGRADLAEWLAAKIVGRWKDGTSLVRHPYQPGSVSAPGMRPDNDFLFGAEDPDGLRCPFGAHIRRANPRDSFEAGSKEQLAISNRHRIFRVGRSYSEQERSTRPGLLFMCVNANIERQFEFMQQTYLLGSSFHGLENEVDAFARREESGGVLTIPTERGPLRLQGMSSFITVRGGGYFFMPGRSAVRFLMGTGDRPAGSAVTRRRP
jgi:Dyp-type peroxidase family